MDITSYPELCEMIRHIRAMSILAASFLGVLVVLSIGNLLLWIDRR